MNVYSGYNHCNEALHGSVLAIGKFDGIHVAHQHILEKTIELAQQYNSSSAVYTFTPNPIEVLNPSIENFRIFSDEQNIQLIEQAGIESVVLEPFTSDYMDISAEDFIKNILARLLQVRAIVVGRNFRFGKAAQGDVPMLAHRCEELGIALYVIDPVIVDSEIVSSGLIRNYLRDGNVARAALMLGRNFFVEGSVIEGAKRGRELGYPTANMHPSSGINPKPGIYATKVKLENGQEFYGATDVGYNPTFIDSNELKIETYLLDFSGDIYKQRIKVSFLARIRDELKFNSIENLLLQIRNDVKFVEQLASLRTAMTTS